MPGPAPPIRKTTMKPFTPVLAVLPIGTVAWILLKPVHAKQNKPAPIVSRTAYDATLAARTVSFYEGEVKRDPEAAIGNALLAGACLRRAAETGDLADYKRAESAARKSIGIRRKFNPDGFNRLAQALVAQHRFREALDAAREAESVRPGNVTALRLQTDILFELGEYAAAESTLRKQGNAMLDPTGLAQQSRFAQLRGSNEEAVRLVRKAVGEVERAYHVSPEETAWFHARLGAALAYAGHSDAADGEYAAALSLFPSDYRTMALRAELASNRGDLPNARRWAEEGAKIQRTPEITGLLGDAYRASGDSDRAERLYRETLAGLPHERENGHTHTHHHGRKRFHAHSHAPSAGSHGHLHDRHLILFAADHGMRLQDALALARHELTIRKDIYTYDALAWVLHKLGRNREADFAIRKALSFGTKDARIHYHAGVIANALGDSVRAGNLLRSSRDINPHFAPQGREDTNRILSREA